MGDLMFIDTRAAAAAMTLAVVTMVSAPAGAQALSGGGVTMAPLHKINVPEGTEMRVRFNDALSSGKNSEGDQFSITLDDDVTLPDGTLLKRGYRGKGEVTEVKKKGMMGQAGEMNVRLNYIKIGEKRVHLRANKGGEGNGAVGATVALTILFGPLGLLKHGHDIEIHPGQTITAFVDEDTSLDNPIPPPAEG